MCPWCGVAVVAAAHIGVRIADLAEHLTDQVIQILARTDERQEQPIAVVNVLPVDAIHGRGVEEIALEPPGILEHLGPLLLRIDNLAQVIEFQRFLGLRILGGIGLGRKDGVVLFVPDQHAQPIER